MDFGGQPVYPALVQIFVCTGKLHAAVPRVSWVKGCLFCSLVPRGPRAAVSHDHQNHARAALPRHAAEAGHRLEATLQYALGWRGEAWQVGRGVTQGSYLWLINPSAASRMRDAAWGSPSKAGNPLGRRSQRQSAGGVGESGGRRAHDGYQRASRCATLPSWPG